MFRLWLHPILQCQPRIVSFRQSHLDSGNGLVNQLVVLLLPQKADDIIVQQITPSIIFEAQIFLDYPVSIPETYARIELWLIQASELLLYEFKLMPKGLPPLVIGYAESYEFRLQRYGTSPVSSIKAVEM